MTTKRTVSAVVSLPLGIQKSYSTGQKNLRLTRDAVSLLHALTGSPHATAQALYQLADEEECRELRPDELRYVLGTLKPTSCSPIFHRQLAESFRCFSQPKTACRSVTSLTERASQHGASGTIATGSRRSISSGLTRTDTA